MSIAVQVYEARWAARRMVLQRWLIDEGYCAEGPGEPMCELLVDGAPVVINTQFDGYVGERYVGPGEAVPLDGMLALGSTSYPGARLPDGFPRTPPAYSAADLGREQELGDFKVFVSYRKADSVTDAAYIAERFDAELGAGTTFIDNNSLALGFDYLECLHDALHRARLMLAVIGPDWLAASEHAGRYRRLDNPYDAVRTEIRAALARGIPVVPVLVRDAPLPDASELPEDLRPLVRRQAVFVRPGSLRRDVDDLIRRLRHRLD